MKTSRRKWLCQDCTVDTGKIREHYFLHNEVWTAAGMGPVGMLCIGCVEDRLGRTLKSLDFTEAWINHPSKGEKSARFLSRLRG